jgi:hypothetical protein
MAEMQDQVMELEQHISQLENGTFGLPEAMSQVQPSPIFVTLEPRVE